MMNYRRALVPRILATLGVPSDGVLLIHSGIRGLSKQGYKAEEIIESTLEYMSEGTLLMPTMSWRSVTPSNPVFDELETPSHTGVLSEIFRTRYSTVRSLHPTHSVAGFGRNAGVLLAGHHLGTTPAPASSPYGLMRDYPAYILMLGVGIEMCTAIHHAEEMIAPEIYVKPMSDSECYTLRARDGREIPYKLRRHPRLPRKFDKFVSGFLAAGMQCGDVEGVPWSLIRVADLLKVTFSALLIDRNGTLG